MTMQFRLSSCLLGLVLIMLISCDDDAGDIGCGTASWWVEVESELEDVSAAAVAFGTDPSPANCMRYIDAYETYIDALRDIDNCVAVGNRQEYNSALDEAEDALDGLGC